jgi:hypothetical protein
MQPSGLEREAKMTVILRRAIKVGNCQDDVVDPDHDLLRFGARPGARDQGQNY